MTSKRPKPFLIADDPALDFLNSLCSPWGDQIEWLDTDQDLQDWLIAAGLADPAAPVPDTGGQLAATARTLREWLRDVLIQHQADGLTDLSAATLAPMQALLDQMPRHIRLMKHGAQWHRGDSPADTAQLQALYPLVRAVADIIVAYDPARIRQCEGPTCTLWFRDVSRSNRRRWCTMAVCGNRAKVAAFRDRQRLK